MLVLCLNCRANNRKSVHEVSINGNCSFCNDSSVMSLGEVVNAAAAEHGAVDKDTNDIQSLAVLGARGKRCVKSVHSFVSETDVRYMTERYYPNIAQWWDGHYFEIIHNYLYMSRDSQPNSTVGKYNPTVDFLLENANGDQKYVTFRVFAESLGPADSKAVNDTIVSD